MVAAVSPAEAVAAVPRALDGLSGTRWVGIDGLGASGKTTLAARIAAVLPGAAVVHIDDFARRDLLQGWERDRFVAQVLEPLLADRPARYQRWDWAADVGAEWHHVPTGVPVIVEGVSSTDVRLGVPWDLTLWLEVSYDERWRRIVARDGPDRLDRWRDDWLPSEEAYVAAQHPQERVDLIVLGSAP